MTDDPALRIGATSSGTGVAALAIDAGQMARALGVARALGTAVGRGADELRVAGARGSVVENLALGVRSARRGLAGVHERRSFVLCKKRRFMVPISISQ